MALFYIAYYFARLLRTFRPVPSTDTAALPTKPQGDAFATGDIIADIDFVSSVPFMAGSYTELFKQEHRRDGTVAVKRIRLDDQEKLKALRDECQVRLAAIQHNHLLPVLGVCDYNGFCIVTQWQVNGNMGDYLKKNPEADRLQLMTQVADGLAYLHCQNIVHGGIHPRNVLISGTGTALLGDYHISLYAPDNEIDNMNRRRLRDKLIHIAPDIINGAPRSQSTDVFAFGMLLFFAYCEQPPMAHMSNPIPLALALIKGERPKREEIAREDFSDELWGVATRCWNREAVARPMMSDIKDLLVDLQ